MDHANITDLSDLEARVLARITEEKWETLTTEFVRTGQPNSTNPLDPDIPAGEEEAIALLVAGKLEAMGMSVEKYAKQPRRPNIVGRMPGTGAGPTLMINDHLDTYPAVEPDRWDKCGGDPFCATRHGDWLHARGTSDTRGNLAASVLAVQALVESGVKLNGDLICCYTVDEEKNGVNGSIYMCQEIGLKADYSITAEPTAWGGDSPEWGMNISVANSGHCLIEVVVKGVKSHIWRPDTSVNAILLAADLVPHLHNMSFTFNEDPFMGQTPPCVTVVRVRGGLPGEMQFSPDECVLTLAVAGIVPGMTLESVLGDIQSVVGGVLGGNNAASYEIRQVPGSLFVSGTKAVGKDEQPCVSIRKAYRQLLGEEPNINRKNAFNDTIRFREAGFNAVTFGPGEDGWSPINEGISVTKSVVAAKIYALAIMDILGVQE